MFWDENELKVNLGHEDLSLQRNHFNWVGPPELTIWESTFHAGLMNGMDDLQIFVEGP